jgi:integrator complex subunit 11
VLKILDRQIILDCGLHMSYNDGRRYPDFRHLSEINGKRPLSDFIDVVLLSHFHLDHCGSLPYLTENYAYRGPILMTTPTRSLLPFMLEDFRRVVSDSGNDTAA